MPKEVPIPCYSPGAVRPDQQRNVSKMDEMESDIDEGFNTMSTIMEGEEDDKELDKVLFEPSKLNERSLRSDSGCSSMSTFSISSNPQPFLNSSLLRHPDVRRRFQNAVCTELSRSKSCSIEFFTEVVLEAAKTVLVYKKSSANGPKKSPWQKFGWQFDEALKNSKKYRLASVVQKLSSDKQSAPEVLIHNGIEYHDHDTLQIWRLHFEHLFNQQPPRVPELQYVQKPMYNVSIAPPSFNEMTTAIRELPSGKAPGSDNITPEMLKALPRNGQQKLYKALKSIWNDEKIPSCWKEAMVLPVFKNRGDTALAENYRGISMVPTIQKILEKIIIRRMRAVREETVRQEQAGFRPGYCTSQQIYILRSVMENYRNHGKDLHIAFLDFAAAFDSVNRERLFKLMRAEGVPDKFVNIFSNMYMDNTTMVKTRFGSTQSFPVTTGIRQGTVTGPFLFNFVLDDIMRRVFDDLHADVILHPDRRQLLDLDYADDVCILAESPQRLQKMIWATEEYAEAYGLRLNAEKCKHMYLGKAPTQPIFIRDCEVEVVSSFCYLGSYVRSDGSFADDIANRSRKAEVCFSVLEKNVWSQDIQDSIKLKFYMATVRKSFLYGSETWILDEDLEAQLEQKELSFFRRMFDKDGELSDQELYDKANKAYHQICDRTHPLFRPCEVVRQARKNFFLNTLAKNECLAKIALQSVPPDSWVRISNKETWLETMKKQIANTSFAKAANLKERVLWESKYWVRAVAQFMSPE